MKSALLKFYTIAFLLAGNFVMFAQDPTETTDNVENPDGTVSISSKLIWLAILGIAFAFYYFASKRKAQRA